MTDRLSPPAREAVQGFRRALQALSSPIPSPLADLLHDRVLPALPLDLPLTDVTPFGETLGASTAQLSSSADTVPVERDRPEPRPGSDRAATSARAASPIAPGAAPSRAPFAPTFDRAAAQGPSAGGAPLAPTDPAISFRRASQPGRQAPARSSEPSSRSGAPPDNSGVSPTQSTPLSAGVIGSARAAQDEGAHPPYADLGAARVDAAGGNLSAGGRTAAGLAGDEAGRQTRSLHRDPPGVRSHVPLGGGDGAGADSVQDALTLIAALADDILGPAHRTAGRLVRSGRAARGADVPVARRDASSNGNAAAVQPQSVRGPNATASPFAALLDAFGPSSTPEPPPLDVADLRDRPSASGHLTDRSPESPAYPSANGYGARDAWLGDLLPPASEATGGYEPPVRGTADGLGGMLAAPADPLAAADPSVLAALIADVLVEQARRHGVDLS